jgi:hypothetical protein
MLEESHNHACVLDTMIERSAVGRRSEILAPSLECQTRRR